MWKAPKRNLPIAASSAPPEPKPENVMAPSFLNFKDLRRRSRASFRTDRSTDASSEASQGATPTTGSLTPPSIGQQSDPALHLQVKDQPPPVPQTRPQLASNPNGANRYSVSGMAGLGSPVQSGRGPALPVSQYSPRITNVPDNSWVSYTQRTSIPRDRNIFLNRKLISSRHTKR